MPRVRRFGRLALVGVVAALSETSAVAEPGLVPLSVYGELPRIELGAISPSGDHSAVVAHAKDERSLIVFDKRGKPVFRTVLGAIKVRAIAWAGDESVLVTSSNTAKLSGFNLEKAELSTVTVVPLSGKKPWDIFGHELQITGGVWDFYGTAQRANRWYGYFGGIALDEHKSLPFGPVKPDLYEVDLQTGVTRATAHRPRGEEVSRDWLVDGEGEPAAALDYNGETGDWIIRSRDGLKLADGNAKQRRVRLVGFTGDGVGVVYASRDDDTGVVVRHWVPLAGGESQPFLDGQDDVSVILTNDRRVVGFEKVGADRALRYFDAPRQNTLNAVLQAFAGERLTLVDSDAAFDRLIVTSEGPGDAGTWYQVDLSTHHADPIGDTYPLGGDQVGAVSRFAYAAADGLALEGVVTMPPVSVVAAARVHSLPVIVLPHGGPHANDWVHFDWLPQALASRGYVVFQPNFRGSTGYGAAFKAAGEGEWGRKMQSDISDGLAALAKTGLVDSRRAAIAGASYGGYAALAGATMQPGLYRCAVSIAGIGDLSRLVDVTSGESGDPDVAKILKLELTMGRDLKAVSPINHVAAVAGPVLLIHGRDDTVVHPSQSVRMDAALRSAGKSSRLLLLPGADHWLSTGATRQATLEAVVDFLTRCNPPMTVN